MTRKFPLYLLVMLMVGCFAASCNDDPDPSQGTVTYANCAVTSFSLAKDDSVLARLDSVYFAIDLVGARIFNADSLPVGTDVSKLVIKVGTSSAAACDITFPIPGTTRDTTINIIDSPKDSINFSQGPLQMVVTSYDGLSKRAYTVSVNVHKSVPDTLVWDDKTSRRLPSAITAPTAQKTVMFKDEACCFTASGTSGSMAVSSDPFTGAWTSTAFTLPAGADITTVEATDDALYLLASGNALYTSADGLTWTSTGAVMDHIYGGYGATLLGARRDADGWKHVTWPASAETAVPAGCPVSGTSPLVSYTTRWSSSPMAIMVGGRDAAGRLTGESWTYDGGVWARLSTDGIDEREDVTLFPYFAVRVDANNWKVTEQSALYAVGGRYVTENGAVVSKTVYISRDFGITWKVADSTLQLPEAMDGFAGAQALVFDTRLPQSRVIKPITEWECPYIYLFGGETASGALIDRLQRGVINRFTFKPVY